jgi:peptidoglycan/xylan/chitin deacetylase (PgdA/CDA1 family)
VFSLISVAKRLTKLVLSLALFAGCELRNVLRRVMGQKPLGSKVIIYYHSVVPEETHRFARQMDMLLRWTKPIRTDGKCSFEEGARYCAVTFDDGFYNVFQNALPELQKRRIPATFFIIAGALGQEAYWYPSYFAEPSTVSERGTTQTPQNPGFSLSPRDKGGTSTPISCGLSLSLRERVARCRRFSAGASRVRVSRDFREYHGRTITADELRSLPPDLVTIGSHTLTHRTLTDFPESEAQREISLSRAKLEDLLGRKVTLFTFPNGCFNDSLVQLARQAGYERVFSILPVEAFEQPDEFVTGRVWVEPTDWPLEFFLKLHGAYRWLPLAFSVKRRIRAALTQRVREATGYRPQVTGNC